MPFVWDEIKSEKNRLERGKGFEEAEELFNSDFIRRDVIVNRENRYVIYGYINNVPWAAVFCVRETDTRVISLRRCSRKERNQFYGKN